MEPLFVAKTLQYSNPKSGEMGGNTLVVTVHALGAFTT